MSDCVSQNVIIIIQVNSIKSYL